MTLRFFSFIWGAMLLSLLIFSGLIAVLNLEPPERTLKGIEVRFLTQQLEAKLATGGTDAAMKLWRDVEASHPGITVVPDYACAGHRTAGGAPGGCVMVDFDQPTGVDLRALNPMLFPLFVGAVVSSFAAMLLSQWLTRPIRTVRNALRALASGKLGTRIGSDIGTRNQAFQELAASFDNAAAQLEKLTEGRKTLFHDISHEIRSPLARLRAAVALMQVDPSRSEERLAKMENDIEKLDRHVGEILTLAQFENVSQKLDCETIDVVDVIEPIVSDANFEGQQKDVSVSYEGPDNLMMQGNAELLHRALENIIRNALNHSPNGGKVVVSGRKTAAAVNISISDDGPGVPEGDLDRIFEPFVRTGSLASKEGVGLGLAIAARAIEAHGGTLSARNRPIGGLQVSIVCPSAPVPPSGKNSDELHR